MIKAGLITRRDNILLGIILFVAFILRFWHLGFQSFWLDELHTMNEADPALPWRELFRYLKCCDQHPPLFYICERLMFSMFGSSEWAARVFPATCGVVSVWALYLLGKELLNTRLGLIAAAFTSVNYFNIYYSQEARGYIVIFMLSAFSYLYFIRLIRHLHTKDLWLYSLFTLLMIYTHYFGLFIACSQFVIAFILLFTRKDKKPYIKSFIFSGLIILGGYAPWLPSLKDMAQIHSFWIGTVKHDFIITFFKEYFGRADVVMQFTVLLLSFYVIGIAFSGREKWADMGNSPLLLSFLIIFVSMVVTLGIPYLRSILVVPMLIDRYTIVLVPLILLCLAYGTELIPFKVLRCLVVAVFVLFSVKDLVLVNRFYTRVFKTQFRELTAWMATDIEMNYAIINDRTGWHEDFYLRRVGYTGPLLTEPKLTMIDSILRKSSPRYDVKGFWLVDAHVPVPPGEFLSPQVRASLDTAFILVREKKFFDAWGQLYLKRENRTRP